MYLLFLCLVNVACAHTTWPMFGGNPEHTHYQAMNGYFIDTAVVKWEYDAGGAVELHGCAIMDIDKDGEMEVIGGSNGAYVFCLRGPTGTSKWTFPTPGVVYSAPAVADVDDDDTLEVIVSSQCTMGSDTSVYCLNGVTGALKWQYNSCYVNHGAANIADVDNDGDIEIIVGNTNDSSAIHCINGKTGTMEWKYPVSDEIESVPAIADMDGDGILEIVVGNLDGNVYCLHGDGSPSWIFSDPAIIYYCSPTIGDVDEDGEIEVLVGSWDHHLYCLDGKTGIEEWKTPDLLKYVDSSPAIADVDADGHIEIVFGNHAGNVYCYDGFGNEEWHVDSVVDDDIHRGIAVADLDCDGMLELLIPVNYSDSVLRCLNGEDGSIAWEIMLGRDIHDITIGDIDNDNCVEILTCINSTESVIALDDIDGHTDCGASGIEDVGADSICDSTYEMSGIIFKWQGENLYLFTPYQVAINLRIYDESGRLAKSLFNGVISMGGHSFVPVIEKSGTYFAVLKCGRETKSVKFIKL